MVLFVSDEIRPYILSKLNGMNVDFERILYKSSEQPTRNMVGCFYENTILRVSESSASNPGRLNSGFLSNLHLHYKSLAREHSFRDHKLHDTLQV